MCGLAGLWRPNKQPEDNLTVVGAMLKKLVHRGPDSHGLWQTQNGAVCLGHRRLAIQDLSNHGHQPMDSSTSRYTIVFNGEIYNFKEIMSALESHGYQFKGHSDTEIILAAFEHWGKEQAVSQFRGMFAIALYDHQDDDIYLLRDRLGEKPLYYYLDNDGLIFSSELGSLVEGINKKLKPDWEEISAYFRYCYFSPHGTPFEQIQKLKPGHSLLVRKPTLKQYHDTRSLSQLSVAYWDNLKVCGYDPASEHNTLITAEDAVDQFESLLFDVVQNQSIADVDLGLFLSGGIDSSLVSAVLQQSSSKPVNTYTIAFDNEAYNEAPYAEQIANHLGTTHTEIPLSMDECVSLIQNIDTLVDEPFADPSFVPTYLVSREARKHVTVCLSGDGGDELFAGYNRYLWGNSLWKKMQKTPGIARYGASKLLGSVPTDAYDLMHQFTQTLRGNSDRKGEKDIGTKVHKLARLLTKKDALSLYVDLLSFWRSSPLKTNGPSSQGYFQNMDSMEFNSDFLRSTMLHDQRFYLPCDNLFKVDRAAMANSLEVRLPLLDHKIVEFANNLPTRFKVHNKQSKWIMRELLYRYVPKELIERPKMGFSMPLNSWLRKELKTSMLSVFDNRELIDSSGLDKDSVDRIWNQHQKGQYDNNLSIWSVFMYLTWFNKFEHAIDLSS